MHDKCDLTLYADNTNLIISGTSLDVVEEKNINILNSIFNWSKDNGLVINVEKSSCILFTNKYRNKHKINQGRKIHTVFGNLNYVNSVKFLGIKIDQYLTFEEHIVMLQKKLRSMIPLFYKIRDATCIKTKLRIYYAYIYSRINYCIEVYTNTLTKKFTHFN